MDGSAESKPEAATQYNQPADTQSQDLKRMSIHGTASHMSSPLSSAPPTPNMSSPRRASGQPAWLPSSPYKVSPRSNALRRTSSALSLQQYRRTASPVPNMRTSRASLGGSEGQEATPPRRLTPRRSISHLQFGTKEGRMEGLDSMVEEPPPLTAAKVAADYFTKELASHETDEPTETVLILHDACYGHRFSRPKTTKGMLSMIVERPERIRASVLGASTAYVRLGGHHQGGGHAPHPAKRPSGQPPFKIRRTSRAADITSSYVTNVHGTAWMTELQAMCNLAAEKLASGDKELSRPGTPSQPQPPKLHEGDLYLCSESLNAFQGALGGVCEAVDTVFDQTASRKAFVAIRPPGHHCSADWPSGFCWLNNVHVGIEYAHQIFGLTHAAIIDFDLHHGDGSQAITWKRNVKNNAFKPAKNRKEGPRIGYYSLHDINSYPCETGDEEKVQAASLCIENAHGQSIWNVHLQSWKTIDEFWELYESRYKILLDKARVFLRHHTARVGANAKAAVFISAGFDASEWESAGMQRHKVNVPTEFYARFTRDIAALAGEGGTGCDGRVISVLEGGYSDRALASGVLSHLCGFCASPVVTILNDVKQEILHHDQKLSNGSSEELFGRMSGLSLSGLSNISPPQPQPTHAQSLTYDTAWWSAANLAALENLVYPPPPAAPKRIRTGPQPTYATPTESFTHKVIDPIKYARSISGTMRDIPVPARPPTPQAPAVDWFIAAHELCKLLIPTDRKSTSCTAEELAGPKPLKKERASMAPAMTLEQQVAPRQLRDRKAKIPAYADPGSGDELGRERSVSRASRRQTIGDLPSAAEEKPAVRRASRRLSAASILSTAEDEIDRPPIPPVPIIFGTAMAAQNVAMKAPPLPKVAAVMQIKKTRAPAKKLVASSASSAPAETNEIDALTSGMKKISIMIGSPEEHDHKTKEVAETEKKLIAKGKAEARKTATTKKAAPKKAAITNGDAANSVPTTSAENRVGQDPASPVNPTPPTRATLSANEQPVLGNGQAESGGTISPNPWLEEATHDFTPGQINAQTTFLTTAQPYHRPKPPHHFIPPTPLQPPQLQQFPDTAHRQLLSEPFSAAAGTAPPDSAQVIPNSALVTPRNSPAQARGKQLPIWTATGVIPFSTNPGVMSQSVPSSPSKGSSGTGNGVGKSMLAAVPASAAAPGVAKAVMDRDAPLGAPQSVEYVKEEGKREVEMDIWAVPDTPKW